MKVNGTKSENNKPSPLRKAVGITTGAVIGLTPGIRIIKSMVTPISEDTLKMYKMFTNIEVDPIGKFEKIKSYAEDIIEKTGLKTKGVKLQVLTPETIKKIEPLAEDSSPIVKIIKSINTNARKQTSYGLNAMFLPIENTIFVNNENTYVGIFHEIGHALNFNNTRILKALQLCRTLTMFSLPVVAFCSLAVGLFSNKKHPKKDKDNPENIIDFIHNNAGKLTFSAFLPILIEEGTASVKGIKLAKPYLNLAQNQMHKSRLFKEFRGYLSIPLIFAGSVALGIFVKDKIVNHQKKKH